MQKVFVTGATGFIGNHLAKRFANEGREVRCLVRRPADAAKLVPKSCPVVGDLADTSVLKKALADVDAVFHLAGLTKAVRRMEFERINVQGTANIAQACAGAPNPPLLVCVSSLAAAGPVVADASIGSPVPWRPRRESDVENPVSNYGRSKLHAEHAARQYADRVPTSIVRPPIVLGPGDKDGLPLFKTIATLGVHLIPTLRTATYSIIHVQDLLDALIAVASQGQRCNRDLTDSTGCYFAANQTMLSFRGLGEQIAQALGRSSVRCLPIPTPILRCAAMATEAYARIGQSPQIFNWDKVREATARGWACSVEKIQAECAWEATVSLKDRLSETVDWYRQQGWL